MLRNASARFLILLFLFAIGCDSSRDLRHPAIYSPPPLGDIRDDLYGSWRWVESNGGRDGIVRTPASEGISRRWEFIPSGEAIFYEDEMVANSGTFDVVREVWDDMQVEVLTFEVVPDYDPKMSIKFSTPDTLLLSPPCCQLQNQKFFRIDES